MRPFRQSNLRPSQLFTLTGTRVHPPAFTRSPTDMKKKEFETFWQGNHFHKLFVLLRLKNKNRNFRTSFYTIDTNCRRPGYSTVVVTVIIQKF